MVLGVLEAANPALALVPVVGAALEDTSQFVLPPLPNTLFTRDSSCWVYGGVSVNPMYWPARRLEAYQAQLLLAAGNPETQAAWVWRKVS